MVYQLEFQEQTKPRPSLGEIAGVGFDSIFDQFNLPILSVPRSIGGDEVGLFYGAYLEANPEEAACAKVVSE